MKTNTETKKQTALLIYLIESKRHIEAEKNTGEYEFDKFDFAILKKLNDYFTPREIDYIIINKEELISKFLGE